MAETLVKLVAGNGHRTLVLLSLFGVGVWIGLVVRLVVGVQTPCWVLKEQACPVGVVVVSVPACFLVIKLPC